MNQNHDSETEVLAETEESGFAVWRSMEEDGYVYHIELGGITLHMAPEEWEEFASLIASAAA
ncbi:MAG: hypothetical protein KJ046_00530 [Anaerolineae bacterium]|nr:hypothetical protein [Anaerolineae bacterium]RIK18761.1 MAG: hypothetical protein DCC51_09975 [Anaerolineae bacterium]